VSAQSTAPAPASVVVVGAGPHAKVIVALLASAGVKVEACYDDVQARIGTSLLGAPVRGPIASVLDARLPAILAVGDNAARERLADALGERGLAFATAVHPTAFVHESVTIGPGSVIFAGAVVQPDARIGAHVIVNTSASVDHDCVLEDFVHLAPGVHLAGTVTVERGAFLGVGTVAIPGRRIGARAVCGAGAVVVRDVAAGAKAVGVPARALARVKED